MRWALLFVGLAAIMGCGRPVAGQTKTAAPKVDWTHSLDVNPLAVNAAYWENAVQADQLYTGRVIKIAAAAFNRIKREEDGRYLVVAIWSQGADNYKRSLAVLGHIAQNQEGRFNALKSGDPITLVGVCQRWQPRKDEVANFILESCRLPDE